MSQQGVSFRSCLLVAPRDAGTMPLVRALLDAFPDALTKGHRPRPGVKSAIQAAVARGLRATTVGTA